MAAKASLRVQFTVGVSEQVHPVPLSAVAVSPLGIVSVTVTVPLVDALPELPTTIVYMPLPPTLKLLLWLFEIVRFGAPVTVPLVRRASTLRAICCAAGLSTELRCDGTPQSSRPQLHWIEPVAKTVAPLADVYDTIWEFQPFGIGELAITVVPAGELFWTFPSAS